MDKCFKGTESFVVVYIDDILVFSKNEKEHVKHLEKILKILEDNGLVLSPTKMKIAVPTIGFLGAVIGEGTIKKNKNRFKSSRDLKFNKKCLIHLGKQWMHERMGRNSQMEKEQRRSKKQISSSSSLLSGGSSTVPQCLSEEYEDHLRRSHEDFQPLPRIFTNEEPGALYRYYQLKANQNPIRMDKSDAWRSVAQDIELSAAKEATITGLTKEKILEFKTKKLKESSLNWKPLPSDWAATTSKPKEVQAYTPEDNTYRYNKKGFLEDDDSSDDLIFIELIVIDDLLSALIGIGKADIPIVQELSSLLSQDPSSSVDWLIMLLLLH
ncbi:Orf y [Tanacetum coccineum]